MKIALFFTLCLTSLSCLAVGLGEMRVNSFLNQPFSASISILGSSQLSEEDILVKLADHKQHGEFGTQRSAALKDLRFSIVRHAGRVELKVKSINSMKEPILNFILQIESGGVTSYREYTALLGVPTQQ